MPILSPATILIVAPPTLQRQGLLATLRDAHPELTLSIVADARKLPDRLRRDSPALLILDAALPGQALDKLIEQVRAARPGQRMLVLGGKRLPFHVSRQLVEIGGGMLLTRLATPGDLLAAVARLLGDSNPTALQEPQGEYRRRNTSLSLASAFSDRELEVLRLVADDCPSHEIATRLCISIRTVESHRRVLLEKAGTRSMVGLVLQAVRSGWLQVA